MQSPSIFDLFRTLAHGDSAILSAIDLIEGGLLPQEEALELAESIWLTMVPTSTPGRRLSHDSIWSRGTAKMVWMALVVPNEKKTRWLAQQIRWGKHTSRPYTLPLRMIPAPSMRK